MRKKKEKVWLEYTMHDAFCIGYILKNHPSFKGDNCPIDPGLAFEFKSFHTLMDSKWTYTGASYVSDWFDRMSIVKNIHIDAEEAEVIRQLRSESNIWHPVSTEKVQDKPRQLNLFDL